MTEIVLSGYSRVWLLENGANPNVTPAYQGLMKIGDPSWPQGDIKRIEAPDPTRYDEFLEVAEVKGTRERVSTSIEGRYPMELSTMLRLTRQACPFDVQVHMGKCLDPREFNLGWQKIAVFERARFKGYDVANFGALGSDERTQTNEKGDLSAKDWYELVRLTFAEQGGTIVTREIISGDVCDTANCGDCGFASDGCQRVLWTQIGSGASPGTPPAVIYSANGGDTYLGVNISTLLGNEPPSDSECVGGIFVVVSNTDETLHWAYLDDFFANWPNAGAPVWVQVTNGFVFGQGPNAIVSVDSRHTWLAADSGYIYFTDDPTQGVTVQEAGVATTQTLNDIAALDEFNVVAVGNSNAVIATDNGGETWRLVTGPVVGQNLTAVWMKTGDLWLVGVANGTLWFTSNQGVTWTQINLPITGSRIDDIKFVTPTVGYLSVRVAGANSQILRTIDGGNTWYVLPEGPGSIPTNTRINQVAVCATNPNTVFGGGLGSGTDGIIVKAA